MSIANMELFAENNSVATLAGATSVLLTINVPARMKMRLKEFGNYISVVASWGLITWTAFWNGVPGDFLQSRNLAVLDQIGYAAQRQAIRELEFGGGGTFTIQGFNGGGVACSIGCSLAWWLVYE